MTGGAGFIGSHVVASLVRDYHVRVLVNLFAGKRENVPIGVELLVGDITNRDDVHQAMQGIDRVVHLAALRSVPQSIKDMVGYADKNVTGTTMICDEALKAKVKRVVSISSSSVYGEGAPLPLREGHEAELKSPYAGAKFAAEIMARVAGSMGLDVVSLRYFNVFGPRQDPTGDYATFIPRTILNLVNGERQIIHEDGEQTRDFNPVANTVFGTRQALFSPRKFRGEAFNIASGKPHSVNEVYELARNLVAKYVPAAASVEPVRTGKVREGDIRNTSADLTNARECLDYVPVQSFEDGLSETVDYFCQRSI